MNKKLKCILLVDDNDADNYIHRKVIESAKCSKRVVEVLNGDQALAFLQENRGTEKIPELIFLDINMPLMNGWEFIEAYEAENFKDKAPSAIVMLSTSINSADADRARKNKFITNYVNKPLDEKKLHSIIDSIELNSEAEL